MLGGGQSGSRKGVEGIVRLFINILALFPKAESKSGELRSSGEQSHNKTLLPGKTTVQRQKSQEN